MGRDIMLVAVGFMLALVVGIHAKVREHRRLRAAFLSVVSRNVPMTTRQIRAEIEKALIGDSVGMDDLYKVIDDMHARGAIAIQSRSDGDRDEAIILVTLRGINSRFEQRRHRPF